MALEFVVYGSEAYWAAAKLRYRLFYQPHGIAESIVQPSEDAQDLHVVMQQNGSVLAYGRLSQAGNNFQIYQMAVEPTWQGQGLGRRVLQSLVNEARQRGGRSLSLNARVNPAGFYEKQGFQSIGGIFASRATGLPHISMRKKLKHYP